MRTVYLINVSLGLAGTERRFANIWQALRRRQNVKPVLVIPEILRLKLVDAGLIPDSNEPDIWGINEYKIVRTFIDLWPGLIKYLPHSEGIRTRLIAFRFRKLWPHFQADSKAIVHFGLPCDLLPPPDMPIIYECMDSTFESFNTIHYKRAALRPSLVNCQSQRIKISLDKSKQNTITKWKTVVSPCYFAHYVDQSSTLQERRDCSTILFIGRFSKEKSPLLFVEAISLLYKRGIKIKGVMLGEGPMHNEIENRCTALGLIDNIFVGFSKNPEVYLQKALVFVSLQTGDNYGSQALLEAMASGCAIVASDVGETWRLVNDEVGIRIPLNASSLADAIQFLLRNPDRIKSCGEAAARRARLEYTADAYANYLESIYEDAHLMYFHHHPH